MDYIDANVFVYAAIDSGALGPKAQRLIRDAIAGSGACTSALTIDEVLWAVEKKLKDARQASDIARKLLRMPVTILAVERRDAEDAGRDSKPALTPATPSTPPSQYATGVPPSFRMTLPSRKSRASSTLPSSDGLPPGVRSQRSSWGITPRSRAEAQGRGGP